MDERSASIMGTSLAACRTHTRRPGQTAWHVWRWCRARAAWTGAATSTCVRGTRHHGHRACRWARIVAAVRAGRAGRPAAEVDGRGPGSRSQLHTFCASPPQTPSSCCDPHRSGHVRPVGSHTRQHAQNSTPQRRIRAGRRRAAPPRRRRRHRHLPRRCVEALPSWRDVRAASQRLPAPGVRVLSGAPEDHGRQRTRKIR